MSLKLILGSAGSGKTEVLLREVIEESIRQPDRMFIVVVPEQVSMQTQDRLTAMHPGGTILNIDVLSFERLSYRVFEELGLQKRELLDETGKTFIIQKIAIDLEDDLPYLGRRMKAPGSASSMKSVISELMEYGIEKRDLERIARETKDRLFRAKIEDIARLYETYMERLGETFMTAEEVPALLSEVVDESDLVKGSVIAFDGFTGFTPVQERLVQCLMRLADRVLVTITYDEDLPSDADLDDDQLFTMSSRMIRSLWRMAGEENVRIEPDIRLKRESRGELSFLERSVYRSGVTAYNSPSLEALSLYAYPNPVAEAEGTARQIARLIRTRGWRYRDIGVVSGDPAGIAPALKRAFTEAGIPFFLDLKRPLLGNPFVEYLRSGVDACLDGYSYDSVFRCLKSGMTDLTADEIDRLENHVLGTGIRSKKAWRSPWTFPSGRETEADLQALNISRQKVCELLDPLSEALASRKSTVRDRTTALYRFGTASRCQEKLKGRQEAFEASGRLDLAREYAQIYGKVMALYDRFVELLGNETMPMADYRRLLEAGLSEIRIGLVPPECDQVMVGDVVRSRLKAIKALFFIGVNEGIVPKTGMAGSFLTEADRLRLNDGGLMLRPSLKENACIQNFYLYLTLAKPTEKLIISYAMAGSSGGAARPSTLITQLMRLFPSLKPVSGDAEESPETMETPAEGLEWLASTVRTEDQPGWYELYGWFLRHDMFRKRTDALLKGAAFRMKKDVISRKAVDGLYGRRMRGSATRLEVFAGCPFRYFAQYGLKLEQREDFIYSGLDRGNVIHEALENFGRTTLREGVKWASLSDNELNELADRCLREAVSERFIFEGSARNTYEAERLRRSLRRSVWAVREQLKAGDFMPGALEAGFADDLLGSSHIPLDGGREMILTGKIDRIDICDDGNVRYVKVIDYKTGRTSFSLTKLYHGLQLQLILYMNAALEMAAEPGRIAVPAGIFYHRVEDPMLAYDKIGSDPQTELLKALKETGFISSDLTALAHFDRELLAKGTSDVAPIRLAKSGAPYKGTSAGDAKSFEILGTYARRKAARLGNEILKGIAAASPYRLGSEEACTYCPYCGVCGFDERLPGCRYRLIKKMDVGEALEAMQEETEK